MALELVTIVLLLVVIAIFYWVLSNYFKTRAGRYKTNLSPPKMDEAHNSITWLKAFISNIYQDGIYTDNGYEKATQLLAEAEKAYGERNYTLAIDLVNKGKEALLKKN
ncbi:MAG: hypothetical protein M1481_01680 [Candidatus Thermoplasmatota archaeon]|jgi:hypothetical protein|nr:hypothetical protein [Candidatus Thermoplasmatota archaeon]MCL5963141.1 hypothetical protein [Candidatus Thermoplasmatota archaeon]